MQNKNLKNNNSGFAILFAVTIAAILLTIALGVANIAFRELKFNTSVKASNDAFYAADLGTECALYNDRSDVHAFDGSAVTVTCLNTSINLGKKNQLYKFVLAGLGTTNQGCTVVTVDKSNSPNTQITSLGYDTGGGAGACTPTVNSVEREIQTNY